jgi:hypothetical protein
MWVLGMARTHWSRIPPFERVLSRIAYDPHNSDSCWIFQGYIDQYGYGLVGVPRMAKKDGSFREGNQRTHRAVWEGLVGPIDKGLVLDHLCRVTQCVNPAHLEPVTQQENVRRGDSPAARRGRRTHCQNGHEFSEANTYIDNGGRRCRICVYAHKNEARRRKKLMTSA